MRRAAQRKKPFDDKQPDHVRKTVPFDCACNGCTKNEGVVDPDDRLNVAVNCRKKGRFVYAQSTRHGCIDAEAKPEMFRLPT